MLKDQFASSGETKALAAEDGVDAGRTAKRADAVGLVIFIAGGSQRILPIGSGCPIVIALVCIDQIDDLGIGTMEGASDDSDEAEGNGERLHRLSIELKCRLNGAS